VPYWYRVRPVVTRAVRWTGSNFQELTQLSPGLILRNDDGDITLETTARGELFARVGDWVVGSIYDDSALVIVSDTVFRKTHEQLNGDPV